MRAQRRVIAAVGAVDWLWALQSFVLAGRRAALPHPSMHERVTHHRRADCHRDYNTPSVARKQRRVERVDVRCAVRVSGLAHLFAFRALASMTCAEPSERQFALAQRRCRPKYLQLSSPIGCRPPANPSADAVQTLHPQTLSWGPLSLMPRLPTWAVKRPLLPDRKY
jgi:hypothetical protein